ncbi:MFS transporter [Alsobacter sp. SYSU M60028]|uniref:MFS transporter n=1 Tax=Alsobacter ponti TaxID=2962936 RepID=A0ABT1LEQ5_9HYPH|nr:MFS transporter [Alsobacter ponti]MCP8939974.1 MFS transporter [Alsobacter ponti]
MADAALPSHTQARRARVRWHGRLMLAAGFALMAVSGLVWNSFSVFLVALSAEHGWSRTGLSAGFSTLALTNAVSAPAIGWLMLRVDSRLLLGGLSVAAAAALLAVAFVESLPAFVLLYGLVLGFTLHACSSYAIFSVLACHIRRRLASAMAVVDSGAGLAVFLGLPLLQWVIDRGGTRMAFALLAGLMLVVCGGLNLLALRPLRRGKAGADGRRFWPAKGLARPVLLLALAYGLGSLAYHGFLSQQIALMEERSVPVDVAVWIASTAGLATFAWRLSSGLLADRVGLLPLVLACLLGAAAAVAGLASLWAGPAGPLLSLYPFGLAIGFGAQAVLLASATRAMVSGPDFGLVFGMMRFCAGLGMFAGPILTAALADALGGYGLPLAALAALALLHFTTFAAAAWRAEGVGGGRGG